MICKLLKNKGVRFYSSLIFVLIETVLYFIILTSGGITYSITTFLSILLAFIFSLVFLTKTAACILTVIALFLTATSDFLLCGILDINKTQTLSVIIFLAVQVLYFIRIFKEQKSKTLRLVHLIIRSIVSASAITVTLLVLNKNANALAVISVTYFSNLILNAVFAGFSVKKAPLFFIGLILFALCDFFIGLNFIESFIDVSNSALFNALINIDFNMAWLFYLPSQTLIALDIVNNKKRAI